MTSTARVATCGPVAWAVAGAGDGADTAVGAGTLNAAGLSAGGFGILVGVLARQPAWRGLRLAGGVGRKSGPTSVDHRVRAAWLSSLAATTFDYGGCGVGGGESGSRKYRNYDSSGSVAGMETRTYTTIDLRKAMGEILDRTRIAGEAAAITRKGKTVAYLVPAEWFEQQQAAQQSASDVGQDAA